jgi:hypothetical protein
MWWHWGKERKKKRKKIRHMLQKYLDSCHRKKYTTLTEVKQKNNGRIQVIRRSYLIMFVLTFNITAGICTVLHKYVKRQSKKCRHIISIM